MTPSHSSEGIAELIERLAVAAFKGEALCDDAKRLAAVRGEETSRCVCQIIADNRALWDIKERQAIAIREQEQSPDVLRELLIRDLELCKSRAAIRAELNRRLGSEVSGESVKRYGQSSARVVR